ncbi:hypothetical protein SSS_05707 [Sarcoptes scabiei]|uniref:Uncharacterized protein n=1 Tax=Sarcoptes scabiei TaxID=52283 RepID=A0A834R3R9_SARSC|nr:hypothetical protein SSS_05707 [Sarcoptes scabiei]
MASNRSYDLVNSGRINSKSHSSSSTSFSHHRNHHQNYCYLFLLILSINFYCCWINVVAESPYECLALKNLIANRLNRFLISFFYKTSNHFNQKSLKLTPSALLIDGRSRRMNEADARNMEQLIRLHHNCLLHDDRIRFRKRLSKVQKDHDDSRINGSGEEKNSEPRRSIEDPIEMVTIQEDNISTIRKSNGQNYPLPQLYTKLLDRSEKNLS